MLPCEAAEVVARLSLKEADDYAVVKASLLRKYRLTTEAFRQRFRTASKKPNQSYDEFAYALRADLTEWLEIAESYDSRDKVVECVCLEQFLRQLPDDMRMWIQDKEEIRTAKEAAEYADKYVARRGESDREKVLRRPEPVRRLPKGGEHGRESANEKEVVTSGAGQREGGEPIEGTKESGTSAEKQKKSFEARRGVTCFNCKKRGHFSRNCPKPRFTFACVKNEDENFELLRQYLKKWL